MKLNKKVCRKLVEPKWSMGLSHGLFCAEQIQYIVESEVRNMDHQKVLILHIYDRRKVATGETRPLWTMFQSRRQYFILARRDNGSTFWRGTAFDNLDRYYLFKNRYTFYSMNDERRVIQFCKTDQKGGFFCLGSLQSRMMCQGMLQKKHEIQRKIVEKVRTAPGLPRGVKG